LWLSTVFEWELTNNTCNFASAILDFILSSIHTSIPIPFVESLKVWSHAIFFIINITQDYSFINY